MASKRTPGDVKVEEVEVENGLKTAGHNGDELVGVLIDVAVDPVDNVESPIAAESKQVVRRYGLRLSSLRDHEELGQDCNRLQVDRECPQDLHHRHHTGRR